MSKELDISQTTGENPFKDIIKFNLKHQSYSEQNIQKIKSEIELEKGVTGLYYENESIDQVKSNLDKLSLGILVLAFCFIILALAIIFNTIQLTLYSDLKEIRTMQMVGAENKIVKKPYLKSAFTMALKSILAVIIFIGIICTYLMTAGNVIADVIQWDYVIYTILICLFVAIGIQYYSTNLIVNRFLKREGR